MVAGLQAQDNALQLDAAVTSLAARLVTLDAADTSNRVARDALTAKLRALTGLIAGLEAAQPQAMAARLAALTGTLATLDRAAQDHASARIITQTAQGDHQSARAMARAAATRITTETAALVTLETDQRSRTERMGAINRQLATDTVARAALSGLEAEIAAAKATFEVWQAVNMAVGSKNGDRFARLAQSITLDSLVDRANHHAADLTPRYRLKRAGSDLALNIGDQDMGGEERATRSLSGGERFLISLSLSLALALSRMGGSDGLAATLFIDEGFGSLDAESLDLAIDA